MAARRGKVGEIFNLARQDGHRGRDGAEQKAHLSRQTALRLAALARARLENLAYIVAPLRGTSHDARDPRVPRKLVTHGYCCLGATRLGKQQSD